LYSLSLRSVLLHLSQLVRAQRFLGRANRSLILGTKATSPHLHRSIKMKVFYLTFSILQDNMSELNPKFLEQRSKFIAIGGVVVCASTLGAVFGLPTVLQRDVSPYDAESSFAAFVPENASVLNHAPPEVDSISKSARQLTANLRTKPTTAYEADSLPPMRQLGNLFLEDNAVRLKLYWQDGYFWQEKKEETW
jgi:hypothetical protein